MKKLILVSLSTLAVYAYTKRKEIAYATIGKLAQTESKLREIAQQYQRNVRGELDGHQEGSRKS